MAARGDIKAGRAFVELFVKGTQFEVGLRRAGDQLKRFGEEIKAIGSQIVNMGAQIGRGLGEATQEFIRFDDQMRTIGAVTKASDAELQQLSDTAESAATKLGFGAVAVGELMAELARAGFAMADIDDLTVAVLNLARAGGTDAQSAAKIMAATIRQFGLAASDASHVADLLTTAANESFTTVEQLAEALQYAGPVASDFNVSLGDTLALFGGLGNLGIQASNAGTAIRRLMTISGSEAVKMQEIFGVSFVTASGNIRPLLDILEDVNAATKNLGSAERAQKFNEAFGLLGITAASGLGNASVSVRDLQKSLNNASGTAATVAGKMNAGLGGAMRVLSSSAMEAARAIGRAMAPALQQIAAYLTEGLKAVADWINNNREMVVVAAAGVAALTSLGAALVATGTAAILAGVALKALASLLAVLTTVATTLMNPIVLATAAVAALTAAFIHASGIAPQLVEKLKPIVTAVKAITAAIGDGEFKKAWDIAVVAVKLFGSIALDTFKQIPEFAAYAGGRITSILIDAFQTAWTVVTELTYQLFNGILQTAGEVGAELMTALFTGDTGPALDKLKASVVDMFGKISGAWNAGLGGGEAPAFDMSPRTRALMDELKALSQPPAEPHPADISEKPSDSMAGAVKEPGVMLPTEEKKRVGGDVGVSFSADALQAMGMGRASPQQELVKLTREQRKQRGEMIKLMRDNLKTLKELSKIPGMNLPKFR